MQSRVCKVRIGSATLMRSRKRVIGLMAEVGRAAGDLSLSCFLT